MTSYNPCPCCPDGNEWNANGPTGRVCKRCGGFAIMHLDGSRLTETEFNAATDYRVQELLHSDAALREGEAK